MEGDWDTRAKVDALIAATGEADEKKAGISAVQALKTRILKGVDLNRDVTILEIGCGIGNLLKSFSVMVREVHGVDISGEMLRLAAERLRDCPNVFLHKTEGKLDMLEDNYFDCVFSSGVFIHFAQTRWYPSFSCGWQVLSQMATPERWDSSWRGLQSRGIERKPGEI
jgi:cyclopropane fatty-acyl-phospholipid synthase-like methyltransferase